jgi:hypothetical protein
MKFGKESKNKIPSFKYIPSLEIVGETGIPVWPKNKIRLKC